MGMDFLKIHSSISLLHWSFKTINVDLSNGSAFLAIRVCSSYSWNFSISSDEVSIRGGGSLFFFLAFFLFNFPDSLTLDEINC
jgi:hypothetical protein